MEFARRIDVPHETIRNREQGKRGPTGAARALLRTLDKASETARRVLTRGPCAYLRRVFTELPRVQSLADIEALLPTRLTPADLN